ncbi:MAG: metal ABC transporter permease [Atribacterota bacterium]
MNPLGFGFMQRAVLAGCLVGVLCALVGVFVVLKRLSFMGAGISHAAFGGVALGYVLGINPTLTAFVFCILTGLGIAFLANQRRLKEDTLIGIAFASTMAFGVFLIGVGKIRNVDLFGYLFGNILAITREDLLFALFLGGTVLFLLFTFYKEFVIVALDPEGGKVSGIPVAAFSYLLVALVAAVVVVAMRLVGIVLAAALLVLPAATALTRARTIPQAMLLAVLDGVGISLGGLFLAYFLDAPAGATIVLLGTGVFLGVSISSSFPKRG